MWNSVGYLPSGSNHSKVEQSIHHLRHPVHLREKEQSMDNVRRTIVLQERERIVNLYGRTDHVEDHTLSTGNLANTPR